MPSMDEAQVTGTIRNLVSDPAKSDFAVQIFPFFIKAIIRDNKFQREAHCWNGAVEEQ